VNAKAFIATALSSALDLGLATGDDVLRHVTPDILASHLPRPLWARLLTACFGASRVDSQLVIETVGVPNLCEHVPSSILWGCLAEIGARALGAPIPIAPPPPALLAPAPAAALLAPMPAASAPAAKGPSIPTLGSALDDLAAEIGADDRPVPPPPRGRTSPSQSSQRFRPSSTGIGRTGTNGASATPPPPAVASQAQPRRPQAAATTPSSVVEAGTSRARRPQTEVSDYDIETDVRVGDDWRATLAPAVDVDDEQLVDWSTSEETVAGGVDGAERKR